jgi:hypothetical protein
LEANDGGMRRYVVVLERAQARRLAAASARWARCELRPRASVAAAERLAARKGIPRAGPECGCSSRNHDNEQACPERSRERRARAGTRDSGT